MSTMRLRLLIEAWDRATRPIQKMASGVKRAVKQVIDAGKEAAKSMEGIGNAAKKVQDVGKEAFLKVTAPIAGFGALSLRTAGNFQAAMNRVGVLTDATKERLARLMAQAKGLGATTQFSASQAANAMGFLAMAGFGVEQIMGSMPGTLELAAAAQMELAQAADIVSNVLTGYGFDVSKLGQVTDVLVKTFASANTDLSQLGQAMKYAGPIASGLGVVFEETAAVIALMGNAGIQASMAGTALRASLARLAKPAKETRQAFARLKISKADIFKADGSLKSLTSIMAKLEAAGADTADMIAIFGQEAGPAMTALLSQGSSALGKMTETLKEAGGTAGKVAAAQMEGFNGEMRKLASAFEALQLAIADSGLLEFASALVTKLTGWISQLSAADKAILKWATILAGAAALIAPLLIGLAGLGFALKGLVIGAASVKAAVIALSGGLAIASAGIKAFALALMATPIGWITAGIAALAAGAYLVYRNWEPISAWFSDLWDTILGGFERVTDALSGLTSWLPDSIKTTLGLDAQAAAPQAQAFQPVYGTEGSAGPAAPGGVQRADVGGTLRVEIEGAPARVREVRSNMPGFDIDVDTGPVMVMP
ncbi:MAG: phage tail tape measure protein [Magnetovibrionaceae bacterium]